MVGALAEGAIAAPGLEEGDAGTEEDDPPLGEPVCAVGVGVLEELVGVPD